MPTFELQDKQQRWAMAQQLLAHWWAPPAEENRISPARIAAAETRLGVTLPPALKEWYAFAGHRADCFGNEDYLQPPEDLALAGNVLVFCLENQAVVVWGLRRQDLTLVDPPVLVDLGDPQDFRAAFGADPSASFGEPLDRHTDESGLHTWYLQSDTLSWFLLGKLAEAIVLSAPFTGRGRIPLAGALAVRAHYEAWSLGDASADTLADEDTLISLARDADGEHLWMGARTRQALDRFRGVIGEENLQFKHQSRTW